MADENGVRYLMLCRVILGKAEAVPPGSKQCHPSSDEFDSGVDDLTSPKKYILWSTHVNTHILPEFILNFRTPPSLKGKQTNPKLCFRFMGVENFLKVKRGILTLVWFLFD